MIPLFIFLQENQINFLYIKIQEGILSYLKIDLVGIFEYLCFSSISINAKYFGKINSEIYLKNYKFIEEEFIRNILKHIIKLRLILFDSYQ